MAIRIEFLAWHSPHPLSQAEIDSRLAAVEGFYPHEGYRRFVRRGGAGHTGLVVWWPEIASLATWCGPAGEALVYASHIPFGITGLLPVRGPCGPADVLALHEIVRNRPETVTSLSAPLALAHLAGDGGLHIHNDFRGFAEVYHARARGNLQVWSSRVAMPLVFGLEEPIESLAGGQLRGVFSYYPHHHTPFENVRRLECGSSVFAGDWPAEPIAGRRNHLLEGLGAAFARQGQPVDYEACRASVSRMLRELPLFWTGPMRSGLTGGRDSRAVLAFLIASGMWEQVPLVTTKILKQDFAVAGDLVEASRRAGFAVRWDLNERPASSYSASNREAAWADFPAARAMDRPAGQAVRGWLSRLGIGTAASDVGGAGYAYKSNPLLDRMVFQFHRLDGQTMPIGYYAAPARERVADDLPMTFGGHSGEVLRAMGYTAADIPAGAEDLQRRRERYRFRLSKSWAGGPDPVRPYPRAVHDLALAAWRQYFDEARAGGIGSFLVFDYLNVIAQQSRRVDVPKQLRLVCPLANPVLLFESYKLPAEQRTANTFHIEMIRAAAPFLLDVPFSHQVAIETGEVRLDMTGKPQFWDPDAVPGFAEIIAARDLWRDAFDERSILVEFGPTQASRLNPYQRDTIGGLLCWRAAQKAYCAVLSSYVQTARQRRARAA